MPTYSYRCTECDHAFDIQQAFTDDSLTVCPACGGKLRKVFNNIAVTFNGSGFYHTDSRAGAQSKHTSHSSTATSTTSSDSSSTSSSSSKQDPAGAKPAAAAASSAGKSGNTTSGSVHSTTKTANSTSS